jgi:hypothetical protein
VNKRGGVIWRNPDRLIEAGDSALIILFDPDTLNQCPFFGGKADITWT